MKIFRISKNCLTELDQKNILNTIPHIIQNHTCIFLPWSNFSESIWKPSCWYGTQEEKEITKETLKKVILEECISLQYLESA